MTDFQARPPSFKLPQSVMSQIPTTATAVASSDDFEVAFIHCFGSAANLAVHEAAAPTPQEQIIVANKTTGDRYLVGNCLGKGGFAKCYELVNVDTKEVLAGKVVAKDTLHKHRAKEKLTTEIKIHQSVNHRHVVGFRGFFEDRHNVYILLELCAHRSLMELHKKRKILTEPEVRYYGLQIIDAIAFMHGSKIIHRDLKLGNLFLNDKLEIKVGDFGLATTVSFDGERKKFEIVFKYDACMKHMDCRTLCGTPNYIAPEILEGKDGHSYEVDIWSLGCILYTLLIGRPPFETDNIKTTYKKIKTNDYRIPSSSMIGEDARALIRATLENDPQKRPSLAELRAHPFFTKNFVPSSLPSSAVHTVCMPSCTIIVVLINFLLTEPYFGDIALKTSTLSLRRDPLKAVNSPSKVPSAKLRAADAQENSPSRPSAVTIGDGVMLKAPLVAPSLHAEVADYKPRTSIGGKSTLAKISKRVTDLISKNAQATSAAPLVPLEEARIKEVVFISKWVDYSNKYGLGYQLTDGCVGVLFNDGTKMVLDVDQMHIESIDRDHNGGGITLLTMTDYPESLSKKVTLLKYFRNYMTQHLLNSCPAARHSGELGTGLPHVKKWVRTKQAIVFRLSNQVIQVNFFDHTKLILDCAFDLLIFVDEERNTNAYRLHDIESTSHSFVHITCIPLLVPCQEGVSPLISRLSYTAQALEHMQKSSHAPAGDVPAF